MSGYALAKATGLSMRGVQMYLRGDRDMSGERVAEIAQVLGLELRRARRPQKGG